MTDVGLIVVESLEEFGACRKWASARPERHPCRVLCLNPRYLKAIHAEGFPTTDAGGRSGRDLFVDVMEKCTRLEGWMSDRLGNHSRVPAPQGFLTDAYRHYFGLACRYFLYTIEVVEACITADGCHWIAGMRHEALQTGSPWIEDCQLYMGRIAERLSRKHGIPFFRIASRPAPLARDPNNRAGHGIWSDLAYPLFWLATKILSKKKAVLLSSLKYNMGRLTEEMRARHAKLKTGVFFVGSDGFRQLPIALAILFFVLTGVRIRKTAIGQPVDFALPLLPFARHFRRGYDDSSLRDWLDAMLGALENAPPELTEHKGVAFGALLAEKIRNDLNPYMRTVAYQAFGMEKLVSALRPDLVLSQMGFEICGALGHAARKLSIPSVLISHGSHVVHEERWAADEHRSLARNLLVGDFDYAAVQSPLAREMALRLVDDPRRVVNIPPTLWGRRVRRAPRPAAGRLTVVHAGTYKLRHNRRFIYETSEEFIAGLVDLCEVIACFPRIEFIVKVRLDGYEIDLDTLSARLPLAANIRIENEKPFDDMLRIADLLVSFSSTTIEEALNNRVPVLLYGGQGRYAHIPVPAFRSADAVDRPVTFVRERQTLHDYFAALDRAGQEFRVPAEAFDPYVFTPSQVRQTVDRLLEIGGIG